MTIEAIIIADSISEAGKRLTTFQLRYPRFIHSEMLTHRVFSRNASSSRAIPVHRMIEMVSTEPAMPIHWGKNQAGMQAKEELSGEARHDVQALWLAAAKEAAAIAGSMMDLGVHKQVANRILEPFQHISVVLTATEYENWFELRDHEDAQPEIAHLARMMKLEMEQSTPQPLKPGEWHLPYITEDDWNHVQTKFDLPDVSSEIELIRKVSAARCCRVSYLKHDGTKASVEEELALCDRLIGARPLHASPFEHQATPDMISIESVSGDQWAWPELHGNFVGWIQHRKLIEREVWSKSEIA